MLIASLIDDQTAYRFKGFQAAVTYAIVPAGLISG
jgi:hypothetical protein